MIKIISKTLHNTIKYKTSLKYRNDKKNMKTNQEIKKNKL